MIVTFEDTDDVGDVFLIYFDLPLNGIGVHNIFLRPPFFAGEANAIVVFSDPIFILAEQNIVQLPTKGAGNCLPNSATAVGPTPSGC